MLTFRLKQNFELMSMKTILTTVALTSLAVVIGMIIYTKFVSERINTLEADEYGNLVGY